MESYARSVSRRSHVTIPPDLLRFQCSLCPQSRPSWFYRYGRNWRGERPFLRDFQNCNNLGCTNYVSSNHLLGHVGGALRLYMTKSVYLAPEAHFYFVHNNIEFTSAHAT